MFRSSCIAGGANADLIAFGGRVVAKLEPGQHIPVTDDPGMIRIVFCQKAPWIALGLRALQELHGLTDNASGRTHRVNLCALRQFMSP